MPFVIIPLSVLALFILIILIRTLLFKPEKETCVPFEEIKLELASLVNANPVKERGMSYMEEILELTTKTWNRPLVSSNVQSGMTENGDGSDGRPKSDEPLSDEGQKTRDKK